MNKDDFQTMFMQGGDKKHDQEKPSPPPEPPARKRDDYDDHSRWNPRPLTESEPPPDTIEPEIGWERE
jgi:hypothetical protein